VIHMLVSQFGVIIVYEQTKQGSRGKLRPPSFTLETVLFQRIDDQRTCVLLHIFIRSTEHFRIVLA
jgi:hypothetical protein